MTTPEFKVPSTIIFKKKDDTQEIFLRHEELGQGGFSVVYRVTHQNTNKEYALKVISKKFLNSRGEATIERLKNEMKIQKCLNHQNIVKSKMNFADELNYYIVLEHCPGQSIRDYMRKSERGYLMESETRKILRDVIKGLSYLHSNNIVHNDIKLENFLIGENGIVKIADFGLSTILTKDEDQKQSNICGTINYISPEILKRKSHSFEVDIWAIGVATFFMLTGKLPFGNLKKEVVYENIKGCIYSFPPTPIVSNDAKNFIKSILKLNPTERPTAADLLEHPFLTKFDKELIDFFKSAPPSHKLKPPIISNNIQKVQQLKESSESKMDSNDAADLNAAEAIVPKIKSRIPKPFLMSAKKVRSSTPSHSLQKEKDENPGQPIQKVRSLVHSKSSQNVRAQSIQRVRPPTQSLQKARAPTPSRKVEFEDQNAFNLQETVNGQNKEIPFRHGIRSSSATNLLAAKVSIPSDFDFSSHNKANLSHHRPTRKSSLTPVSRKSFTIPSTFVVKYCLHGDDVGYLLGNGTVGICFGSLSLIVMDPTETFVQYYKSSCDSSFEVIKLRDYLAHQKKNSNDLLFNRISLVMRFAHLMKKTKNSADEILDADNGEKPILHVKHCINKNDCFLFRLSDRNIQVNFHDHTKMILFLNTKKACFVKTMHEKCSLIDLNDFASMNPDCDERQKFKLGKSLLTDLSRKIQSITKH